jgi:hypothetical protein
MPFILPPEYLACYLKLSFTLPRELEPKKANALIFTVLSGHMKHDLKIPFKTGQRTLALSDVFLWIYCEAWNPGSQVPISRIAIQESSKAALL